MSPHYLCSFDLFHGKRIKTLPLLKKIGAEQNHFRPCFEGLAEEVLFDIARGQLRRIHSENSMITFRLDGVGSFKELKWFLKIDWKRAIEIVV
ncbi:hypothetical protein CEXT_33591 [Caerostris extrusa]|uniref:Uncharacterized protein n=1 Tax=Caerostris extrusa TaxID=172846 RepID=A0AAV4PPZ5_CAEEX|nr:hypothetical protein CEXT_33591 [Caerostris extrusa]